MQEDILSWLKLFLGCYSTKDVTPYIHAFVNHVCEFLYKYHNISFFNQQGLEKLNETTTKMFFRGTNMKGKNALTHLILKRSRITTLENKGSFREKRKVRCRYCYKDGHTILTCSENCMSCNVHKYKTHLVKVDKLWIPSCSANNFRFFLEEIEFSLIKLPLFFLGVIVQGITGELVRECLVELYIFYIYHSYAQIPYRREWVSQTRPCNLCPLLDFY